MSIFFWFLIIAVATLAVNMIVILNMRKRKSIKNIPVFAVLCLGYLAAGLLYLITAAHGTQILEKKLAVSLPIEAESYRAAEGDAHTAYTFCSREGMSFHFDDTQLLSVEVPQAPQTVEIYYCKTRTGYAHCYLSEGTAVRYLLK